MTNKIATVLISTASLPHEGIASWTTEMNYLLERENNLDYVIGPKSNILIKSPIQIFIKNKFFDPLMKKINYSNRFNPYIRGLKEVLKVEENILLQVKDNFGLLKAIINFINKNDLRKRVYIQYQYHSFYAFSSNENLLGNIDELVLLTEDSYKKLLSSINVLTPRVSILSDGVDSTKFKPLNKNQKSDLRKQKGYNENELIFIWCSQDRKKKGLDFTLQIFDKLLQEYPNKTMKLLIFGTEKKIEMPHVYNMGKVDNKDLIQYYQLSDFYLFPTLWQEGFGLSLLEALKCGALCIASNNGAVPVVLNNGEYGVLIERPNLIEDWIKSLKPTIDNYVKNDNENPFLKKIPNDYYDVHKWYKSYNENILKSKEAFYFRNYI